MRGGDESHPEPDAEGGTLRAAGDGADLFVSVGGPDGIIGAGRRRFAGHFECDEALLRAVSFLLAKNFSPSEGSFVQRHKKSEACFDRSGGFVEFVAVE